MPYDERRRLARRAGPPATRSSHTVEPAPLHERMLSLQRTVGNAAVARGLIQRYTGEKDAAHGQVQVSENRIFVVKAGDTSKVYRRKGSAVKVLHCKYTGRQEFFGVDYDEYEPERKFLADCLHTAEEIMLGQPQHVGKGERGVRSRVWGTKEAFGSSDAENAEHAKRFADAFAKQANDGAKPAAGQAYAIVETGKIGKYPYHAAAVIGEDGDDRVTTEVFATNVHAKERDSPGAFAMYSVSGSGTTFHSKWAGVFSKPITVVIEPK